MLKTDPAEVTVPFLCINCIFEDVWVGHGGKAGGDKCLHREMRVLILPKILLQTRCENRYNNSHFGIKQIGKYFSHLPWKKVS